MGWRFTDVTHDCNGRAGSLPVTLDDALQGEVTEQHADAALSQVDVMLAARARDGGDPGSHRPSAPARGWDRTWRKAKSHALGKVHVQFGFLPSGHYGSSLVRGSIWTCKRQRNELQEGNSFHESQMGVFVESETSSEPDSGSLHHWGWHKSYDLKAKTPLWAAFTNRASVCFPLCFISTMTTAQKHGYMEQNTSTSNAGSRGHPEEKVQKGKPSGKNGALVRIHQMILQPTS